MNDSKTARDVVVDALTARHEELRGEASPRDFDGASQILNALDAEGYSIVKLDPLGTALDPYIEDNDHIDHDSGTAGDECNRCVAEEAYRALGLNHPAMDEAAARGVEWTVQS